MTRIAIHGFYGQGNLGDKSILYALLREFNKFTGIKIKVFSSRPKNVSRIHKIKGINSQGKKWDLISLLKKIYEIKFCDLFILGGGGLLKDYGSDYSSLNEWLKLLRLAKRLKTKTALCSVGVENIRYDSSIRLIRNALKNVDLITVRDIESRENLRKIGIEEEIKIMPDPAILLQYGTPKVHNLSLPPKIVVCVRHWYDKGFYIRDPRQNKNFISSLSSALDLLVDQYDAVIDFIPLRTISFDDDRRVAREVISGMNFKNNVRIFDKVPEIMDFIKMIERASLLIGMRLHSLILASIVGVPMVAFEYMSKVRAFMNCISQNRYSLDMKTVDSEQIISLIGRTFKNYNQRSKAILSYTNRLQRITRKGIEELVELAKR